MLLPAAAGSPTKSRPVPSHSRTSSWRHVRSSCLPSPQVSHVRPTQSPLREEPRLASERTCCLGLARPDPRAAMPGTRRFWELPPSSSLPIVLLRGSRLDGSGTLYFDGQGTGPSDAKQVTVVDSRGGQTPFFSELRLPLDSNAAFYAYPTTAGCYAIRADSGSFSEVIVFPKS